MVDLSSFGAHFEMSTFMAGWKVDPGTRTLQDPHYDEVLKSSLGAYWAEKGGHNIEDNSAKEDPLAAKLLRQPSSWHLGDEVAPEIGAQDQALLYLCPGKRSILK